MGELSGDDGLNVKREGCGHWMLLESQSGEMLGMQRMAVQ